MSGRAKGYIAGLLLFASSSMQASFIDHGYFVSDTSSGLDWLDISFTVGRSAYEIYQDTLDGSLKGWRNAGYDEVFDLASQFDGKEGRYFSNGNYDDSSYSDRNNYLGIGNDELGLTDFIEIFGGTYLSGAYVSLNAWFAVEENDLPPCDNPDPCGYIESISFVNDLDPLAIDYIITDTGSSPVFTRIDGVGTLVIRESIDVAEPSVLGLLLVGIFGFGLRYREKLVGLLRGQ